jgi:dihydrofolate reductase
VVHRPEVVGIAAVGRNGVIGAESDIPWRIPEDWRRFKAMTTGHVLIMGRKTYDSIGRPLPGRTTIVLTRDPAWRAEGVRTAPSLAEGFALAESLEPEVVFVAGGGEVYRAAWSRLDRLELTEVDQDPDGDVTFPAVESADWAELSREKQDGYSFVSYRRRPSQGSSVRKG